MLFDVIWCFCCHSVQIPQGMQETSGPCTIRPAAGPETKSSRMAPRHIGLATKRQGASRDGKWWEMMGNFENGITGTTAQRFKLCLMFAPRCLLFCLMDLLPLFWPDLGWQNLCVYFPECHTRQKQQQQDPVANPCRQRPGKVMPGDARC